MGLLSSVELGREGFVTAYGPKLRVRVDATEKYGAGAKQSFKEECDINRIMAKYQKTGVINWLAKHEGRYGDLSAFDFMEAQLTVVKAKEMFADLPSSVRERFAHDPAKFLAFMEDGKNVEEAIKLGLAKRVERVAEPPKVVPAALSSPPPGLGGAPAPGTASPT